MLVGRAVATFYFPVAEEENSPQVSFRCQENFSDKSSSLPVGGLPFNSGFVIGSNASSDMSGLDSSLVSL